MARVRLESVERRFDTVTAVEEISFEVPDGQFWVLVGPSGCGKSTVLRIIAGLEAATSGNVYIGQTLVNQVPARQRDVAMVFQNYALYPHMSVAENLAFGLRMRQVDAQSRKQQIMQVAQSLDIAHLLDRKPGQLSGGQQQRVALGRAIARQPQVFLLDEPLSNLDAQLRDDTRTELKQLHQQMGITTIYVTHDQVEAMTLADQIVVMNRGRIQQIGSPQQVYMQPINRMVASFIGNPGINLLHGIYDQNAFHCGAQALACPSALQPLLAGAQGHHFNLGIRPENIQMMLSQQFEERQPNRGVLQVQVRQVEPLGRENLIATTLLGAKDQHLQVMADNNFMPQPGDRLTLQVSLEHLLVFDHASGDRIIPPQSATQNGVE